jgi:hypothetical protein
MEAMSAFLEDEPYRICRLYSSILDVESTFYADGLLASRRYIALLHARSHNTATQMTL